MRGYRIGTLAKAGGVGVDTVRQYERVGLIAPPPRTAAGYRRYGEKDVGRLRFIRRGRELVFSLEELATPLEMYASGSARAADVLAITQGKIAKLRMRMPELADLEPALIRLADDCQPASPASECPILAHLDGLSQAFGPELND